jgi:hypothetical protein
VFAIVNWNMTVVFSTSSSEKNIHEQFQTDLSYQLGNLK